MLSNAGRARARPFFCDMAETTDIIEDSASEPELLPQRGPNGLRALRNRDYAFFWAGLIVSATGLWMQSVALGWLVFDLTKSQLYLGIVSAAATLPVLFLTLPAGVLADRISKRVIVLTTQTTAAVLALLLAALAYSGAIQPWHIIVFAAVNGCVNALDVPARQSMVMELVGKEDLLNAVALNSSAFNLARVAGPAIAGVIIAASGAAFCFLLNGISYVAVIAALLVVRSTRFRTASESKPVQTEIVEGLRYARSNSLISGILLMTGIMSVFALQYASQMPALAEGVLKVGPKGLGMLVSGAGLGALAAALSVAAIGHLFRQQSMMLVGSLLAPIGILLLSMTRSYHLSVACMVVIGFGMMLFLAVSNSVVQIASPDNMRGRIISLRTLVFMGLAPFGALQVGVMAEYLGVQPALRYGALICIIAAVYFALRHRHSQPA